MLSNQVMQEIQKTDNCGYWRVSVEDAIRKELKDLLKQHSGSTAYIVTGVLWDWNFKASCALQTAVCSQNVLVPRNFRIFKAAYVVDATGTRRKEQLSTLAWASPLLTGDMGNKPTLTIKWRQLLVC
eukprot:GILK01008870.1.p1 GENE.GILK01008870.1~~GILK01008870.1.p1  ORF type:complete len:127 (-),score=13.87 GILK01008870.1:1256-1636(-)